MKIDFDTKDEISLEEIRKKYENKYANITTETEFLNCCKSRHLNIETWRNDFCYKNFVFELILYRMFILKFDKNINKVVINKIKKINTHSFFILKSKNDISDSLYPILYDLYDYNEFDLSSMHIDYKEINEDNYFNNLTHKVIKSVDKFIEEVPKIIKIKKEEINKQEKEYLKIIGK